MQKLTKLQERKKKKGICIKKFRRKDGCSKKGYKCHNCYRKDFKEKDPASVAYSQLKQNAKHRGKPFNLTLSEFRDFCKKHDYLNKKGVTPNDLQIDRMDTNDPRGYHKDNIQPLTQKDNVRKYFDYERFRDPTHLGELNMDLPF